MEKLKVTIKRDIYDKESFGYTVSRPSHISISGYVSQVNVYDVRVRKVDNDFLLEEKSKLWGLDDHYNVFGIENDLESAEERVLKRAREKARKIFGFFMVLMLWFCP